MMKFQTQTSDFFKGEPMKFQTQTPDFINTWCSETPIWHHPPCWPRQYLTATTMKFQT
jgi:hypothetical protein